jgi:hypothetical protein
MKEQNYSPGRRIPFDACSFLLKALGGETEVVVRRATDDLARMMLEHLADLCMC